MKFRIPLALALTLALHSGAFAQDAAANQQAHDAPSLLLTFTLLALEVIIRRFVAVTDETGKQRAAQPPTTHSASALSKPPPRLRNPLSPRKLG